MGVANDFEDLLKSLITDTNLVVYLEPHAGL